MGGPWDPLWGTRHWIGDECGSVFTGHQHWNFSSIYRCLMGTPKTVSIRHLKAIVPVSANWIERLLYNRVDNWLLLPAKFYLVETRERITVANQASSSQSCNLSPCIMSYSTNHDAWCIIVSCSHATILNGHSDSGNSQKSKAQVHKPHRRSPPKDERFLGIFFLKFK